MHTATHYSTYVYIVRIRTLLAAALAAQQLYLILFYGKLAHSLAASERNSDDWSLLLGRAAAAAQWLSLPLPMPYVAHSCREVGME